MKTQSYENHSRFVPAFHFVTSGLIVVLLGFSIINCCNVIRTDTNMYAGVMPIITAAILLLLFWYSRKFAVAVQDRAIRAEENFRHFILTGKPLDSRLTMGQIIALRFAGDDEYLALMHRAINENLKGGDIKKAIKNWRADNYRC